MNDPPGTIPLRSIAPHPRRPPAHKSVSLRHSTPISRRTKASIERQSTALSSPTAPASNKANPPSSVSPGVANKQSSGESSDAGKWFERTNNNAIQSQPEFIDNDPPFFLRNSSSSGTPPDGHGSRGAHMHAPSASMPRWSGLMQLGTDGSSAEEFRGVIDDLTVANKKLKKKLRKYEKTYDAHLQDEKLFEVRFHGLPDHKKKELEEMLQKFAGELDNSPESDYPNASSYAPRLDTRETQKSNSMFAESGYASMSASGKNSTSAPSGQDSGGRRMSRSRYNQQQSIQSYLHDIPPGLLPNQNVPMTEKAKKKLVVLRLEQIFAGKRSSPGNHSQPLQQEEVAQSAALADRRAREAQGQLHKKEGLREAHIMGQEDEGMASTPMESLQQLRPNLHVSEQDIAGSHSPDQRPTRPLDLDIFRAQVPAENMKYFRHLGFSPPDMVTKDASTDGHGWLYLNLLINVAQLHTLHVTPDFIKDALNEYSTKFELSSDGRRIRWKGGHELTRNSDSSSERLSGASPMDATYDSNSKSPHKRIKAGHSGESSDTIDSERRALRLAHAAKQREQNKLAYVPLFHHKQSSEDEEDYYGQDMLSSSESPFLAQQRGDSSGFGSSAMQSSSSRKHPEDGPMIFYNKAKFCTDLTGDRRGLTLANPASYESVSAQPLGVTSKPLAPFPTMSDVEESRGPLDATPMDIDLKEGERTLSSEEGEGFTPLSMQHDVGSESPATMDFIASGVGGVQPDDNFAIDVTRTHMRTEPSTISQKQAKRSLFYPKKVLDTLNEPQAVEGQSRHPSQSIIKEEIISASYRNLPSSTLPPASFLAFDSASSGDVDSDLESDASSNASLVVSSSGDPATAMQDLNLSLLPEAPSSGDHEESDAEESAAEDSGNETDESVDLLATARKLYPQTIFASELEYDATLADRLAEEILAGSSAATVGGGSGFNSPASAAHGDADNTKRQSIASGSSRPKSLKRVRTSENFPKAQQPEKTQKKE